jgi:hypothetical protein
MKIKSLFSTALLCSFSWGAIAQQGLDIKSVSVFKDQTAFFVKEGNVKTSQKTWALKNDTIPAALNGTFWLSSPTNDFELVKAYEKKEKITDQAAVTNFTAMLTLNDGKQVSLYFKDTAYTGKIIAFKKKDDPKADMPFLNTPLFALQLASGKTMVFTSNQMNTLKHLEFADTPEYLYDYKRQEKTRMLQVDFKSDKTTQPLNMMYLSKGLAWKPDYLVELVEEGKAKLTLRSTVINNAENIETDKLNLVAGVPNFKYATVVSDLINFLQLPVPAYNQNIATLSNSIRQESIVYNYANDFAASPTTATGGSGGGRTANITNFGDAAAMEDLYFYTLKNIVLKKGERAFFDIFQVEVPVEHIYESIIKANNVNYTGQYSFTEKKNPVLHTIKLTNDSKFTWTAAPALVMKNDKKQYAPISQDKLRYTSQANDVSVKLTEAPDVNVKFKEEEVSRTPNKKSFKRGNYTYYNDFITVETEVIVHNFKNKDIRLDLKRLITGELIESNEEWQKSPRVQYGYHINSLTDVCWEMKLKAGEQKTIKYSYSYYTTEHR